MEYLDFSEEEIEQQLNALGYPNISKERLQDFKRDLDLLICQEKSKMQSTLPEWSYLICQTDKSVPAIIKEKVQMRNAGSNCSYIFRHNGTADQQRQVWTSTENESCNAYSECSELCDSVTISVAPRYTRLSTTTEIDEVEEASPNNSYSVTSETVISKSDFEINGRKTIKRKVLRKHKDHFQVCESICSELSAAFSQNAVRQTMVVKAEGESISNGKNPESMGEFLGADRALMKQTSDCLFNVGLPLEKQAPVSEADKSLDQMQLSAHGHQKWDLETLLYKDRYSSVAEKQSSASVRHVEDKRSRSECDIQPRLKSFIRPVMEHPHFKNLKKADPVAKYFQYKQDWKLFKTPEEKNRKELHCAIREELMYQPPQKPQRTYVPNTYVVPTEKKRSALRWEIRHDLANGIIPTKRLT